MYIWQLKNWPHFHWNEAALRQQLDHLRLLQGQLYGSAANSSEPLQLEMDTLIQTAIRTSEIEGKHLDAASVRSSVARQLGIEKAGIGGKPTADSEAMVELLLHASRDITRPLTLELLCHWQNLIFPESDAFGLMPVRTGTLRGEQPMQVISGRLDNPKVHFRAPPRQGLEQQLHTFIDWYNQPPAGLDPLLRAAITHLWLLTLHPFDDGNGRVARALTDHALAQAEQQSIRFYSLSEAIMAKRNSYYQALEQTQKGSLDITGWLHWFLDCLQDALERALLRVQRVLQKTKFWQQHRDSLLNERQLKVLNRLLDNAGEEFVQGISTRHYQSITHTSKATASRDLADLLEKGCLRKLPGGGRSTRYTINM